MRLIEQKRLQWPINELNILLMQTDSQQKLNVLNMQSGKTGWLKITATRQKHTEPWGLRRTNKIYTEKIIQWDCGSLKYNKLSKVFLANK